MTQEVASVLGTILLAVAGVIGIAAGVLMIIKRASVSERRQNSQNAVFGKLSDFVRSNQTPTVAALQGGGAVLMGAIVLSVAILNLFAPQ